MSFRSLRGKSTLTGKKSTESFDIGTGRTERAFEQELPGHPRLRDVDWPPLVAVDCEVGAAFCLTFHLSQGNIFHAAVGYGSGEVKCIDEVDINEIHSCIEKANKWPVVYRHTQGEGVSGPARVTCLAFSPNGEWLGSTSWDGTLILYNRADKQVFRTQRLDNPEFTTLSSVPHLSCTNQLEWGVDSGCVVVAVSRVRKFQQQTLPKTIPGAVVIVTVPNARSRTSSIASSDAAPEPEDIPDRHEVTLTPESWSGLWSTKERELSACWCVSMASIHSDTVDIALQEIDEKTNRASVTSRSSAASGIDRYGKSWRSETTSVVAVGCGNATVRVYAVAGKSAFVALSVLVGHRSMTVNGGVWDVVFLPERSSKARLRLASAGEDHQIILWDVAAQCMVTSFNQASQGFGITRIGCYLDDKPQWRPNQTSIEDAFKSCAGIGADRSDNKLTHHALSNISIGHSSEHDTDAGTEKLMIVSASWDNSLTLWDVESASVVKSYSNIHTDAIFDVSLIVSHIGRQFPMSLLRCVTVSRDKKLKLWNYELGSIEGTTKMHGGAIVGVVMLRAPPKSSAQVVATGSHDGKICALDLNLKERGPERVTETGRICSLTTHCAACGAFAYGDAHGNAHVLRPEWLGTGIELFEFGSELVTLPHSEPKADGMHELNALCWLGDRIDTEAAAGGGSKKRISAQFLVGACSCRELLIWRVSTGQVAQKMLLRSPQRSLCDATESLEDSSTAKLLSGGEDGVVHIWEMATDQKEPQPEHIGELHGHTLAVVTISMSADGMHCATGSWDCLVILWHLPSQSKVRILRGHTQNVTAVVFCPFSNDLVSASWDRKILVWNVGTSQVKHVFLGPDNPVGALCVTEDSRWMVIADTGGFLMVRPLNSPTVSLLLVWRSFFKAFDKLSSTSGSRKDSLQLLRAFICPPSPVCHATLFPFRITLVHYFAMTGDLAALRCCFAAFASRRDSGEQASIAFVGMKRDCFGKLAIDWALERNHMDCVDEILLQASSFPWQMGEILATSLPKICQASIRLSYPLRGLSVFLDSRLQPPLSYRGEPTPTIDTQHKLPGLIAGGVDFPSLSSHDYCRFLKVPSRILNPEDGGSKVKVRVLYLPSAPEYIANMKLLLNASPGAIDAKTIQSDAWEALTEFLWLHTYRHVHLLSSFEYVGYMIVSLSYVLNFKMNADRDETTRYVHGGVVATWNVAMLLGEAMQMCQLGVSKYFGSVWNFIHIFNYMLFLLFVCLDIFWDTGQEKSIMLLVASLGCFVCVFNVMYYFRGVQALSIVIRIISRIVDSLKYYIFVLFTISLAFVLAFWVLLDFPELPDIPPGCKRSPAAGDFIENIYHILEAAFTVGMQGEDRFTAISNTVQNSDMKVQVAVWVFYFTYIFLMAIVMLNLLVAVMNHAYDEISKQSLVEAKRERWAVMDDLDSSKLSSIIFSWLMCSCCRKKRKKKSTYPRYLVMYTDRGAQDSGLRPGESTETVATESQDLDMRISALMVSHFADLERLIGGLESQSPAKQGPSRQVDVPIAFEDGCPIVQKPFSASV